jgi:hypothetical protein
MYTPLSRLLTVCLLCACTWTACKPKIQSFSVAPLSITAADSVRIAWVARGEATLLTHTDTANLDDPDNPLFESREYTLVVRRKGKEIKRTALVNVLPVLSADNIVFPCERRGDTLVAYGEKNIERWGKRFIIQELSSACNRDLLVVHENKTALLTKDGNSSNLLQGVCNSGNWEIKTPLTAAEKQDSSLIPSTLRLRSTIKYNKL